MKKSILVIDDDVAVRKALQRVLEEAGYWVSLAQDGETGAVQLRQSRWDLMVLDLGLPGVSGWDVLDLGRSLEPSLPVIILTGLLDQCEPGAFGGADALLVKPPEVALLLETVQRLLAEPAEARTRRLADLPGAGKSRPATGPGYLRGPAWTSSTPGLASSTANPTA